MAKLENKCREVIEKGEWVAIATAGADGPHLAGTWGEYIRAIGIGDGEIRIPVGGYITTEKNLLQNSRIELLCGTRSVEGVHGPGKGCRIRGRGRVVTSGDQAAAAKKLFPWSRGVLVVTVDEAVSQL